MVSSIRIYFEGGGDSRHGKNAIREGFHKFLESSINGARCKGINFVLIACGSRNRAFNAFRTAIKDHSTAFNILLVDSEGPIEQMDIIRYLSDRDSWTFPVDVDLSQVHLMVEVMESWFMADLDALSSYYGQGFSKRSMPRRYNVEEIPKAQIYDCLTRATRQTQKGNYLKLRHGAEILKRIDPAVVVQRSHHCQRLFDTLNGLISG